MELTVKRFNELDLDEYHEILKLRCDIFVVEQQSPYPEVDDADKESTHVYFRDENGAIAAYARIVPPGITHPTHSIGRVLAVQRGTGLGRKIMEECIRIIEQDMHADTITIEAQVRAKGFYEKLGFVQSSDEFDDCGVPHIEMKRTSL